MDVPQAITFFEAHQPLPISVSPELRRAFNTAITCLQHHFEDSDQIVPLLLNCWSECGIDELESAIIGALQNHPLEIVAPHIAFGLRSPSQIHRIWFGEVARYFPHPMYVEPLLSMLQAEENLERLVAAVDLEPLADMRVVQAFRDQKSLERDPEISELLEEILTAYP